MPNINNYLIIVITIIATVSVFNMPPIEQDMLYHNFADTRIYFSIPNTLNVLSNILFLVVAIFGLYQLFISKRIQIVQEQRPAFIIFLVAVAFIAVGSGYYHLSPNNDTLFWDRLPIAISIMALLAIVITEFVTQKYSKYILSILLFLGICSVLYWRLTELKAIGDLRPYILVQFLPIVIILLLLLLNRKKSTYISGYWALLICYTIAKLFEHYDHEVFATLSVISGHTLKHLAAAIGVLFLVLTYRQKFST